MTSTALEAPQNPDHAESEASFSTDHSFNLVTPVEVNFVLPDGEVFTKQLAASPDFGTLWKTVKMHTGASFDMYMDDQLLTNKNARKLIKEAISAGDDGADSTTLASVILDVKNVKKFGTNSTEAKSPLAPMLEHEPRLMEEPTHMIEKQPAQGPDELPDPVAVPQKSSTTATAKSLLAPALENWPRQMEGATDMTRQQATLLVAPGMSQVAAPQRAAVAPSAIPVHAESIMTSVLQHEPMDTEGAIDTTGNPSMVLAEPRSSQMPDPTAMQMTAAGRPAVPKHVEHVMTSKQRPKLFLLVGSVIAGFIILISVVTIQQHVMMARGGTIQAQSNTIERQKVVIAESMANQTLLAGTLETKLNIIESQRIVISESIANQTLLNTVIANQTLVIMQGMTNQSILSSNIESYKELVAKITEQRDQVNAEARANYTLLNEMVILQLALSSIIEDQKMHLANITAGCDIVMAQAQANQTQFNEQLEHKEATCAAKFDDYEATFLSKLTIHEATIAAKGLIISEYENKSASQGEVLESLRQQLEEQDVTLASQEQIIRDCNEANSQQNLTNARVNIQLEQCHMDGARMRKEAREKAADYEGASMHLNENLQECQMQLKNLNSELADVKYSYAGASAELHQCTADQSDCLARVKRLDESLQTCRGKIRFKSPPRVTLDESLTFSAESGPVTLTGSCEDDEGGFLMAAEWIHTQGISLQMDGKTTKAVNIDIPPGAERIDSLLTLSGHKPGTHVFLLRCADNLGNFGNKSVTIIFKHFHAPEVTITGPPVASEEEASLLQVSCNAENQQIFWDIWRLEPNHHELSGQSTEVVVSSMKPGDYNLTARCEDLDSRLSFTTSRTFAVRQAGVLGIDLATTYSCAAYDDGHGQQMVFIRDNGHDDEDPCMPSCIAFHPDTCMVLIGEPAKRQADENPANTFCDIKNKLTGRRYSEQLVQDYKKNASWYDIVPKCEYDSPAGPCDKPLVRVVCKGMQRFFEPEQLSALMLSYMKDQAEAQAGHSLGTSVVSVPAAWNNYQRKATLDSARIADLNCKQLVNEPTAAILHVEYKLAETSEIKEIKYSQPSKKNVMVFDAGGGTTDISIVFVVLQNGRFDVIGTGGSPVLGGTDFDKKFVDCAILPKLKDRLGEVGDLNSKRHLATFRLHAERAKIQLSDSDQATLKIAWDDKGNVERIAVRRHEFESCVQELVNEQMELVKSTVKASDLVLSDVSEVYLVGGQAQIPLVKEELSTLFGHSVKFHNEDPRSAVAMGASRLAATHVKRSQHGVKIRLAEVIPLQLGIEISTDEFPDEVEKLVEANSPIPYSMVKKFTNDDQPAIEVKIIEGPPEARQASDPRAHVLGKVDISGIPLHSTIPVTFSLDSNGVLQVAAEAAGHKGIGGSFSTTLLNNAGHMLQAEMDKFQSIHEQLMNCMRHMHKDETPEASQTWFPSRIWNLVTGDSVGSACASACTDAIKGLLEDAGSSSWAPPSLLTPEQVAQLTYRSPNKHHTRLDLVVLMDNTGSMAREILAAQIGMKDLVQGVSHANGGATVRVAVVGYRDHNDAYVVKRFQGFTTHMSDIQSALDAMRADGGGDGPEAVLEALQEVDHLSFDPTATKLLIHVADAPPHGVEPGDGDSTKILKQIAHSLHEKVIKVFPVLVEPNIDAYHNARSYYVSLAKETDGLAVTLRDAKSKLIPFLINLATTQVNNAHIHAEISRMAEVFDDTWTTVAKSTMISHSIGKRGKLKRLIINGHDVGRSGGNDVAASIEGDIKTGVQSLTPSDVAGIMK